jgi:DNA-binding NarL/FixJ family response regulator
MARRALQAGAHTYVLEEGIRKELPDIILEVHRGMKRIEPAIAHAVTLGVRRGIIQP